MSAMCSSMEASFLPICANCLRFTSSEAGEEKLLIEIACGFWCARIIASAAGMARWQWMSMTLWRPLRLAT